MSLLRARDLVGTWRLERWEVRRADGRIAYPMGERAGGIAIYGADGWMSATLTAGDRAPLSMANAREASEAERAAAFNGCFAYACNWRVAGGTIEHEVRVAHNPSMVGTVQRREARIEGDVLTVGTGAAEAGGRHELVWHRAASAADGASGRFMAGPGVES